MAKNNIGKPQVLTIQYPIERIMGYKEEELILSKAIADEERELVILTQKRLIVQSRIEEIELIYRYVVVEPKELEQLTKGPTQREVYE